MADDKRPLKVFLCHASADKPKVRELYQRLKAERWIDPWLDAAKLLPGQHWSTVIKQSLAEADAVIIFISNASITHEGFSQRELNIAWDYSLEKPRSVIYLIPVRLEDCEVPYELRERQWVDFFGDEKEETYNALLQALKIRYEQKLRIEAEENLRYKKEKQECETAEKAAIERAKRDVAEKIVQEKTEREAIKRAKNETELQERILEAAIEKEITVGKAAQLFVLIKQIDSKGIISIVKSIDEEIILDENNVKTREIQIEVSPQLIVVN